MAWRDARQAPGRAARDRPRRRPAAAVRRHRAQSHARGRDVPSARRAHDLGEDGRRAVDWENLAVGDVAAVLRGAAVHQSRPHARRRSDRRHHGDLAAQARAVERSRRKNGEVRLHRAAVARLRRVRAAGAGGAAAPARTRWTQRACSTKSATRSAARSAGRRPLPPNEVVLFLREFYTAERAFLEREQLYGKVRPDKFTPPTKAGE